MLLKTLKRRFNNATLKLKIVVMMAILVILTPTILVSMLAYSYYHFGIENLFHDKISRALSQSVDIAEAYVKEHRENIKADALAISKDIERNYFTLMEDPSLFKPFLNKQAELRSLSEILVFQRDKLIAKNSFALSTAFEKLPINELNSLYENDVVIFGAETDDKVRAVIKLNSFVDTYLFVGKFVDKSIINHLKNTKGSKTTFNTIIAESDKTRKKLEKTFIWLTLLLCLTTIFIGLRLARNITKPINLLVDATKAVSKGNYTVSLTPRGGKDEISVLTSAFNSMIQTIGTQQQQLMERRRFIEATLKEITSGILVIDAEKNITLFNDAAKNLLSIPKSKNKIDFRRYISEIEPAFDSLSKDPNQILQTEIIRVNDNKTINLLVRLGAQINNKKAENFIVTIDDITELVMAQRSAAWSDVARRIAHEIKNPLTPIQLSAERIQKKFYSSLNEEDGNTLKKYTNTIIRHVKDIGNIVEEFIVFAKIPSPKLEKVNLLQLIKDAIFSEQFVNKDIEYIFDTKLKKCTVECDSTQINQVLTNLLKNAAESIEAKAHHNSSGFNGKIALSLFKESSSSNKVNISVKDNGIGFNNDNIDKVMEPYVTTKSKGTGLGLPIVKKIVEDHGGKLNIKSTTKGAEVLFSLLIETKEENNGKK